jgi:tight adherence protein C
VDSVLLVVGLAAFFVAVVLALVAAGALRGPRTEVAKSLAAVGALRSAPKDLRESELARPFGDRVVDPMIAYLVAFARRTTTEERIQRVRRRLDLAGNPQGWDTERVLGLKALGTLVGGLVLAIVSTLWGAGALPSLGLAVTGALLGWFGPDLWLYQTAYDRSERLRRELPDAIDLLTISVESGLAFDAALSQVARNTAGPLAAEFFRVLQEMRIGTGRVAAMRALAERSDVPELRTFVGAMVQADAFGIPISNVLRVQSRELRVKRSQRAEAAAQKVPIKVLFPLIFCIMPCLFIVVMGPAAIAIINNFAKL